ncbi:MAG TPA: copper resistance protein CopC [Candidatus Polarisedimenticolia bacterium]|nr:copper resistance protein CopC [Candidatus Polarisedimenticolia bacterium]
MGCRRVVFLVLATLLGGPGRDDAWAHAGLRLSDPLAGVTLGDTPKAVRLSFTEKPEVSLSVIRVLDTDGVAYQIGRPERIAGDPLSLSLRVRHLDRGIYTVSWRVVSAVDAHATAGAFTFGVRVAPTGSAAAAPTMNLAASPFELLARWILIVGLVALLGAASASVARFGGRSDLPLAAGGWLLALIGLVLLAEAQRRNAAAPFAKLLSTSVGRALIGRAIALGAAGCALLAARWVARFRRTAMAGAALSALAAVAVHVAAGHAAAGSWLPVVGVGAQWAHFSAAGIWLGGLAALLLGVRGAPSATKTVAVRRFSNIAAAGLFVVATTGVARTLGELASWRDLVATGYGRAVSAKIALIVLIAAFGALNRWRSVPAAATDLNLLRRSGSGELGLTAMALAAAAALGTLPPPARLAVPPGLSVAGADFGTTVRVRLTAPSDQPGPNRFTVHVDDYDSQTPVRARRVSLRFTPLDDSGVESTSLALLPGPGDSYIGSGGNLSFDGRWRVTVLIERTGDSVEVPLDVETRIAPRSLSIDRLPGRAPTYMLELAGGLVQISPEAEHAGRSKVTVTCFNPLSEERSIEEMVITTAAGEGPARQHPVRRLGPGRFAAEIRLSPGRNRIAAIARASDGTRLRAVVDLDVPRH